MNSMRLGFRRRGGRVGVVVEALFARALRKTSRFSALIRQRGRHDFFFNRLLMSTAYMLPLLIHRSTVSRETCRRAATSWIVSHRKSPSWFPEACMASPALPNWSILHLPRSAQCPSSPLPSSQRACADTGPPRPLIDLPLSRNQDNRRNRPPIPILHEGSSILSFQGRHHERPFHRPSCDSLARGTAWRIARPSIQHPTDAAVQRVAVSVAPCVRQVHLVLTQEYLPPGLRVWYRVPVPSTVRSLALPCPGPIGGGLAQPPGPRVCFVTPTPQPAHGVAASAASRGGGFRAYRPLPQQPSPSRVG